MEKTSFLPSGVPWSLIYVLVKGDGEMLDFLIGRYDAVMSCAKLRVGFFFVLQEICLLFCVWCICFLIHHRHTINDALPSQLCAEPCMTVSLLFRFLMVDLAYFLRGL